MTAGQPERWLTADEEFAAQLRPALRMARNEGPSASAHERMWGALAGQLSLSVSGGAELAVRSPVSSPKLWWWVVGSAIGAGAIGFSAAVFMSRPAPVAVVTHSVPAAASQPIVSTPRVEQSFVTPVEETPRISLRHETSERVIDRSHARRSARAADLRTSLAGATARENAATEAGSDLARELDLLARARRVVASDPGRALQLTAEHARSFQDGVLAQEREVLAIDALTRLGHRDLAAVRARRFIEKYPDSAHRVRLAAELDQE